DAELARSGGGGLDRGADQRRHVEPGRADGRVEPPGLRAEVAVLRAAARLHRDDALDLDLGAAPPLAALVREGQRVGDQVVGEPQDVEHRVAAEAGAAIEDLLAGGLEDLGHAHPSGRAACVRRKSAASNPPPSAGPSWPDTAARNSAGPSSPIPSARTPASAP